MHKRQKQNNKRVMRHNIIFFIHIFASVLKAFAINNFLINGVFIATIIYFILWYIANTKRTIK